MPGENRILLLGDAALNGIPVPRPFILFVLVVSTTMPTMSSSVSTCVVSAVSSAVTVIISTVSPVSSMSVWRWWMHIRINIHNLRDGLCVHNSGSRRWIHSTSRRNLWIACLTRIQRCVRRRDV